MNARVIPIAHRTRHRHRLRPPEADPPRRTGRGGRRHADGRADAPLLAPHRHGGRCQRHAAQDPRAGRGPDPVPRRPGSPWLAVPALRAPRRVAVLRQGRRPRHPLLLPRLAVRRAGPLPGAALRARRRARPRPAPPALVPAAGTVRPDLGLHGPAGEEAGAAALRMPGGAGRRRVPRGRRHQHRRRRAADHPLQLAAALREPGRPLPRRHPAFAASAARSSSRRWR